jgi:hypothetical protein
MTAFNRLVVFHGNAGTGFITSVSFQPGETLSEVIDVTSGTSLQVSSAILEYPFGTNDGFLNFQQGTTGIFQMSTTDLSSHILIGVMFK